MGPGNAASQLRTASVSQDQRKCIGLRGLRKYLFLATQAQQLNKECERCSYYYLDDG